MYNLKLLYLIGNVAFSYIPSFIKPVSRPKSSGKILMGKKVCLLSMA